MTNTDMTMRLLLVGLGLALSIGCTNTPSGRGGSDTKGGVTGFDGADNTDGTTGTNGTEGTDGTTGSEGTDGTTGSEGTDGTTGSEGTDGTTGTAGTDGTDGTSSTDGTDGTTGLKECTSDTDCPTDRPTCAPQGVCILCYPGTFTCQDEKSMKCEQFGGFWEVAEDCAAAGGTCNPAGGKCESGCGGGGLSKTNAGCEFVAIDLENAFANNGSEILDAQNATFAVIASNTSDSQTAVVTVTAPDGQQWEKQVAPNSLQKFNLPSAHGLSGTGKTNKRYKVVSTQPITAYQFNPLDNEGVFSNDASVLLPTAAAGTDYYVVTLPETGSFKAYFTVAAISDNTTVTVTPAGPVESGSGVPAMQVGQASNVTLAAGEVLNVRSGLVGSDLTGTRIQSDKPVVVMSGHVAAVTADKCCADHLEQQMTPVPTWGKDYVLARSMERGPEPDYFVVVAAHANTQVTVSPAVVTPPTVTLQPGQSWKFKSTSHVRVVANQPVMVAQFLASSQEAGAEGTACITKAECPTGYDCIFGTCSGNICFSDAECGAGHVCAGGGCTPVGDPALILAVPNAQWQTSYVFLSPDSYVDDYVNVVVETGGQIQLDGAAFPASPEVIPGTNFVALRAKVADGQHRITGNKPFSITAYGYDRDVSYGYPGGLGLATQN